MVNTRLPTSPTQSRPTFNNGVKMAAQIILIPAAFKVGKKVLAKPVIRPANRMLKMRAFKGVSETEQLVQATVSNPSMGKIFTKTATDDVMGWKHPHRLA